MSGTLRDKRFILVILLTAAVAAAFWSGSRYPALNEKLLMGTSTPYSALAFSTVIDISPDAELIPRITYATINWAYTNRQGMSFGILFGALVMTLLALTERRSFRSGFANAAIGMAMGMPLGVCINCATPIAKAIRTAGGSTETSLAAMVSSPTLNVIVLSMLFALFPLHMAVIKIGLTVGFILIGIPVLTRLVGTPAPAAAHSGNSASDAHSLDPIGRAESPSAGPIGSWLQAGRWVARNLVSNLWFIVKTTVPLMLLAGLLGSALVTLVPLETLADLLPSTGRRAWLALGGVALLGVFLPVPMSFDVIVTAVLWQAGLPPKYAMVLLFTLGIFSIYSFLIVWQTLGARMATGLYAGAAGLGIVGGLIAQPYFEWDSRRQQQVVFEVFSRSAGSADSPRVLRVGGETREERLSSELVPALRASRLLPQAWLTTRDDITVERVAFAAPTQAAGPPHRPAKLFTRAEGGRFGLDEPYSFSVLRFEPPFVQFRGVASGDVHNDGWMDILFTSDSGLTLYANRQGRFVAQAIEAPALKAFYVVNAALVDLDSDGWLDIVFSTYRHGTHVIHNREGRFAAESLERLPTQHDAMQTGAMAFGDVDGDGDLDMVFGNWLPPCRSWLWCDSLPFNNYVLLNAAGTFHVQPLSGIPGRQTLSLLLSDLNGDGVLDLVVGNEDRFPDAFLFGEGDGRFRQLTRTQGIIPHSAESTMSVSSADISNQLRPAIYVGQITAFGNDRSKTGKAGREICDEIAEPGHRKGCLEIMRVHGSMPSQIRKRDVFQCLASEIGPYLEDCIAYSVLLWGRGTGPQEICDLFPDRWESFRFNCHLAYKERKASSAAPPRRDSQAIPSVGHHNVLLTPTGDGRFDDRAAAMGVQLAGFTWNAKFADLDNDEFVDLYAVNGWFPEKPRESHVFYGNQRGQRFIDRTTEAGLVSFLPTSAYTYVDLDNDGDLDIVAVPVLGPVLVYVNNSKANRIAFELRDHVGNRSAIGSKIIVHYGPGAARHQLREIQASGGFISFDAPVAYFGLGGYAQVDRVEVQWSTRERNQMLGDFKAGARYIIKRHLRAPPR